MSSGILEVIKQVAVNSYAAENPVSLLYGKVLSVSPIEIKVSDTLTLDSNFITAQGDLVVGDEVSLFRHQGGQKYIVLGNRTNRVRKIVEIGGTT